MANDPQSDDLFGAWHFEILPETVAQTNLDALNVHLQSFFARLREAKQQYDKDERNGVFLALGAMCRFIVLFEAPHAERLQTPILKLMSALVGLDRNEVAPMLAPISTGGRSFSSPARQTLIGFAAGTVERIVRTGVILTQ